MTEANALASFYRLRERTLTLYFAATVLLLIGVGVLALYAFELGPLVGPGVESSFGYAVALMFLMGALLMHIVDYTYRVWPLGRRVHPTMPPPATDRSWAIALGVFVIVVAGGAIAYLIAGLLS